MSWWGKIAGGTFGFMLGGPLGAALGAALGHNFDRGLNTLKLDADPGAADVEKIQSAFFTATFSIMGHVAKADGRVDEAEISTARNIMRQMRLSDDQQKVAMRLFEEGKQPGFSLDDILKQFKRECHRRRNLLQMFLEIQIMTALADGRVDEAEHGILSHAARMLGFREADYRRLLEAIRAQQQFHRQGGKAGARDSAQMSLDDAYKLLGIGRSATDDEVKKAYRRQMNQHHPDKLVSKGLPQEMMDIATQKAQDIRAAYDLIRKSRKS